MCIPLKHSSDIISICVETAFSGNRYAIAALYNRSEERNGQDQQAVVFAHWPETGAVRWSSRPGMSTHPVDEDEFLEFAGAINHSSEGELYPSRSAAGISGRPGRASQQCIVKACEHV